jgi:hypothetical protein
VYLVSVALPRAVVAGVAHAIAVAVALILVLDCGTVVAVVTPPIAIGVRAWKRALALGSGNDTQRVIARGGGAG